MKLSEQIKPISYLKANAAEIIRNIGEDGGRLIITQNGEAKAILMDIDSYEDTQETLALLKILALGEEEYRNGEYMPFDEAMAKIRKKRSGENR